MTSGFSQRIRKANWQLGCNYIPTITSLNWDMLDKEYFLVTDLDKQKHGRYNTFGVKRIYKTTENVYKVLYCRMFYVLLTFMGFVFLDFISKIYSSGMGGIPYRRYSPRAFMIADPV